MKKQLTEADLALLKKRGKVVNGFTTSNEPVDFSKLGSLKKVKKKAKKAKVKVDHPLVGRMLHTSWGYDMTINDFCKIVEVSPTGKTVVCRMLTTKGFNGHQGHIQAGDEMHGDTFRLRVKSCDWGREGLTFNGSYPFCNGSKRKGYFSLYNGEKVWENHMD